MYFIISMPNKATNAYIYQTNNLLAGKPQLQNFRMVHSRCQRISDRTVCEVILICKFCEYFGPHTLNPLYTQYIMKWSLDDQTSWMYAICLLFCSQPRVPFNLQSYLMGGYQYNMPVGLVYTSTVRAVSAAGQCLTPSRREPQSRWDLCVYN